MRTEFRIYHQPTNGPPVCQAIDSDMESCIDAARWLSDGSGIEVQFAGCTGRTVWSSACPDGATVWVESA